MTKPPAVALDHVSKWYGQVIGINDISIAIDGLILPQVKKSKLMIPFSGNV